jgi:hypothetical protein
MAQVDFLTFEVLQKRLPVIVPGFIGSLCIACQFEVAMPQNQLIKTLILHDLLDLPKFAGDLPIGGLVLELSLAFLL